MKTEIEDAPAAAPDRPESPDSPTPRGSGRWKLVAGLVLGLALAAWSLHAAWHAVHYEETDDAYVTGHVHQVSPQLDAQVQAVLVADNQDVQAGDVLVRLDRAQPEVALQKAQAALAQARAQAQETRAAAVQAAAQVAEMRARVEQGEAQRAQSTAQRDLARLGAQRAEQLFSKGGVTSQAELDNARSADRAAEAAVAANDANLAAARSAIGSAEAAEKSAQAQVTAADAAVEVALAAVHDAERQLGYVEIKAPAAGRIGNRTVEVGNRVATGQTLLSVASNDTWIVANFKETQLARMQRGQLVEVTVDALPGQKLQGAVDSIAPASGSQFALLPADNATGNFNKVVQRVPVKIVLDAASQSALGSRLRLGLSAIVDVRVQ